ncbi:HET-domain-containing protein [Ophiobolus disseminans]|uniref:HET-domain-containing protein n=1 Tax=Ophiobolus disseminans TaxID=1469910 RepID=A0A6A7AM75_9PLEO|nr:HET-domain-containing protein [Ophiobolus disseminans]
MTPPTEVPFSYATNPWIPATSDDDLRIRLIELQPSGQQSHTTTLKIRVFWTSLATHPPFKALSYAWGTGPASSKCYVKDKYLSITQSLELALQHIRHESETVTIWADQISINQSDDAEKSEQVANMDRIYPAASEVIVWLGPASADSDDFMDAFNQIGDLVYEADFAKYMYAGGLLEVMTRLFGKSDPSDPETIKLHNLVDTITPLVDERFISGLVAFARRPWFTRIWAVQEYALANTAIFICGKKSILAETAQITRVMVSEALESMDPELRPLSRSLLLSPMDVFLMANILRKNVDAGIVAELPLFQLLLVLYTDHALQATNACDNVYAVLGLATDTEKLGLRADYTVKNRIDLIFARTTKAIIENRSGEILSKVQYPKGHTNLPSWVPDFTGSFQSSWAEVTLEGLPVLFNPSGSYGAGLVQVTDELTLGTTGFVVDEIEEIRDVWYDSDAPRLEEYGTGPGTEAVKLNVHINKVSIENFDTIDANASQVKLNGVPYRHQEYLHHLVHIESLCAKSVEKNNPIYSTAHRREEAIWRIPVGDAEMHEKYGRVRATSMSATAYTLCKRNLDFLREYRSFPISELRQAVNRWELDEATKLPWRFRTRMRWMANKRPFITKEGYVGMGPKCMKEGDLVVVLGLGTLPYVVRRVDGEQGKFRLLGECYCDGIMDGEIVDKREEEEVFLFV